MNTQEAEIEVKRMIALHCPDYKFIWNNRKCSFGYCNYRKKIIALSKPLTLLNGPEVIFNTIKHEIAHALAGKQGHNRIWRNTFISLGGTGERCSCGKGLKGKYIFECPNCARETSYHRRPRVQRACGECCDKFNYGKFSHNYILVEKK